MFNPSEQFNALIMIVDDGINNVKLLNEAVNGLADVIFTTDGGDAVRLAAERRPDVILLDIEMPGTDGYAVCASLKANAATAHCSVIFVTSHASQMHELQSFELGGIDFIQKPLNIELTRARVKSHIALHTATKALARARQDLSILVHHVPALITYWSRDFANRFSNDVNGKWFGIGADAMTGLRLGAVIGEENAQHLHSSLVNGRAEQELAIPRDTGAILHVQASLVQLDIGDQNGYLLLLTDVSARKLAEQALQNEKERMRLTLDSIGDAVICTDSNACITFLNPVAEEMTGWQLCEAVGAPIETVMPIYDAISETSSRNPIRLALAENRVVGMAFDCELVRRDGRRIPVEDSAAPIIDADGKTSGAIIVFHDVSEARAMAFKMTHLAQHDALTNLPNRTLLRDRTAQAMEQAARDGQYVALILIDLDNFKVINSTVGHAVGDLLLQMLAERLRHFLRTTDTLSRQGGDEFIVLLPAMDEIEYAGLVAHKLLSVIAEPFQADALRYTLSASIGVSIFPDDSLDQDALYRHADSAMYRAKQDGKNCLRFYASEIEDKLLARYKLERDLRLALEGREFINYYQPKVDWQSGCIVGLEALVRWRSGSGQLIMPGNFIALAEETGLIVPIGNLVLAQACAHIRELGMLGLTRKVSVNISPKQFESDSFTEDIETVLRANDVAPALLELEITEGTLMGNIERSRAQLFNLKRLGVTVSIDDFGTGYSSLSYLKKFPIDVLKIDQSFVKDMLTEKSDSSIISAIINLASSLDLSVVAEGVELAAQADALAQLGCHVMQGYVYSKPISFDNLLTLLRTEKITLS